MKRLKRIKKYHRLSIRDKEFLYEDSWYNNEFLYMDSFGPRVTGIKNLIVCIGPNPKGFRIKVSNIPDRLVNNDFFVLTLPDYRILGQVNEEFITLNKLNQLKHWCDKNMKAIIKYSKWKTLTNDFLSQLKPLCKFPIPIAE